MCAPAHGVIRENRIKNEKLALQHDRFVSNVQAKGFEAVVAVAFSRSLSMSKLEEVSLSVFQYSLHSHIHIFLFLLSDILQTKVTDRRCHVRTVLFFFWSQSIFNFGGDVFLVFRQKR